MPTDTGVSTTQSILDTFLEAYRIKRQTDVETPTTDRNIPDRVDVASGAATAGASPSVPTSINWTWVTLGLVSIVGLGVVLRVLK